MVEMTNKTVKDADIAKLLHGAANELKSYIDDANTILKHTISSTSMSPPDYRDYQTCQELADLAKQFEPKEQKMEKQKYKSVPVEGMSIWDLGKAISEGGEFYCVNGHAIYASNEYGTISSHQTCQVDLNKQLKNGHITTRQPLPWYELEGAFDHDRLGNDGDSTFIMTGYCTETGCIESDAGVTYEASLITPLNKEQAAKYGVELCKR